MKAREQAAIRAKLLEMLAAERFRAEGQTVRAEAEILPVAIAYPRASGAAFFGETFPSHLARMARSGASNKAAA